MGDVMTVVGRSVANDCWFVKAFPFASEAEARAFAPKAAAAPALLERHSADLAELDLLLQAVEAGDPVGEIRVRIKDLMQSKKAVLAAATGSAGE